MNTQQIYDYVQAVNYQMQTETLLHQAMRQLNPDNSIMGTSSPLLTAYTKLVQQSLTPTQFMWLEHWMYECDFGRTPTDFAINSDWINTYGMTFFKYWETINEA